MKNSAYLLYLIVITDFLRLLMGMWELLTYKFIRTIMWTKNKWKVLLNESDNHLFNIFREKYNTFEWHHDLQNVSNLYSIFLLY